MTTQPVGGRTYEFGLTDRLRIAREKAGYTQRQFEEVSGISKNTIVNYENGHTPPRRPQLIAWALATGFSVEWLETGKSPTSPGNDGSRAGTREYSHLPCTGVITTYPAHEVPVRAYGVGLRRANAA